MNRAEYEALKGQFQEEHRRDLEALERVWLAAQKLAGRPAALADDAQDLPDEEPPLKRRVPSRNGRRGGGGKVIRAIREIAQKMPPTFTRLDLEAAFAAQHLQVKTGSMKAAIGRLVEVGFLEVTKQGIGRKLTVYRVKPQ
jgi:hypothetical protein